jgi:DNA topoisomerase-1
LQRLTKTLPNAKPAPRRRKEPVHPAPDPVESARLARLRYLTDAMPGIRRRRVGKHFAYVGPDGKPIGDESELKRIHALVIPPAWTDVWICPTANGHLQATGRDARGRKQYRYHSRWREVRDEVKYERTVAFGEALPQIRRQVTGDLALPGLPKEKVLAAVVRLLETTLIRVGNEEYARENRSFGLTTLMNRHVNIDGSEIRFRFRGKSGKAHYISIRDRRLARIVQRCQEIPGQELFQYVDEDGETHMVGSDEVNEYIREVSGQDFTAKDFRTWAGTVLAAWALEAFEEFDSEAQAKHNIVRAIEAVAERLGNTPAICRKCYVHPAIIDAYMDGTALHTVKDAVERELTESLDEVEPEEVAVLVFLRHRLQAQAA